MTAQGGEELEEECETLYVDHDLTARERQVLDKLIEGFEQIRSEYGET